MNFETNPVFLAMMLLVESSQAIKIHTSTHVHHHHHVTWLGIVVSIVFILAYYGYQRYKKSQEDDNFQKAEGDAAPQ